MDLNNLMLALVTAVVGALAGGAGALALGRRSTQQRLAQSEADQVAAVEELRKQHAQAVKQQQRQHEKMTQTFEAEQARLQTQMLEMAREVEHAREALSEMLRNPPVVAGGALPRQDFAPTMPMAQMNQPGKAGGPAPASPAAPASGGRRATA